MSPFREIAVLPLQSQNRQPAYRARKRHSTTRLRTDARRADPGPATCSLGVPDPSRPRASVIRTLRSHLTLPVEPHPQILQSVRLFLCGKNHMARFLNAFV